MSKFWIGFLVTIVVLLGAGLVLRMRRKKKRFVQGQLKHPTGYVKYHTDTLTKVKRALEPSDSKKDSEPRAVATFDFKGDLRATLRHSLSRVIDEIILNKESFVEVVARVESPGGSVTEYGHVYSEMCRIPQAGLKLTVCVDSVAASGGYLMSLPATQILAAPFAMIGSIGVVSFVPNVRRLLEKLNIEPRTFTAGEYKRTVTLTDNATPEEVEHYKRQLTLIHEQFKVALHKHRPQVDLAKVATGDAWLASSAEMQQLGLVDRIAVSSDYLLELNRKFDIVEFTETRKRRAFSRLRDLMQASAQLYDLLLSGG